MDIVNKISSVIRVEGALSLMGLFTKKAGCAHQWRGVIEEYRNRLSSLCKDSRSSLCAKVARH
jgi:hypothetical protein